MHFCVSVHFCVFVCTSVYNMLVYMCECTYIYRHVNVCKYIYVSEKLISVRVCVIARKNAWIYMCVHVNWYVYLRVSTCVYACVRACVRACVFVCNVYSVRVYEHERECALMHANVCVHVHIKACLCLYLYKWTVSMSACIHVCLFKTFICAGEWTCVCVRARFYEVVFIGLYV